MEEILVRMHRAETDDMEDGAASDTSGDSGDSDGLNILSAETLARLQQQVQAHSKGNAS